MLAHLNIRQANAFLKFVDSKVAYRADPPAEWILTTNSDIAFMMAEANRVTGELRKAMAR